MLIVRVELASAITKQTTEIARMYIANDGAGTHAIGHYNGMTLRGRSKEQLDKITPMKKGRVIDWPRQRLHVWNLVSKMLKEMRYVQGQ